MGFLKRTARFIKLNGAAIPDLDMEVFKNAGSFEHAVELLVDQFDDDLKRLASGTEVAADVQDINRESKIQRILDANRFAGRVDNILAYRCRQYVKIAQLYKVAMLAPDDRKRREDKALSYISKMKNTLDLINKLALESLRSVEKKWDTRLYSYLVFLSKLTWEQVKDMLQKGDVPFRHK